MRFQTIPKSEKPYGIRVFKVLKPQNLADFESQELIHIIQVINNT